MEHHINPLELNQINAAGCDDDGLVIPRACDLCGEVACYGMPPVWWCSDCNQTANPEICDLISLKVVLA